VAADPLGLGADAGRIEFEPPRAASPPALGKAAEAERVAAVVAGSAASAATVVTGFPERRPPARADAPQGAQRQGPERGENSFRSKRAARSARQNGLGKRRDGRGKQDGRRNGQRDASRLSRSTPIREVVREGQEVIVQVSKEPIGTKGARVTSHVSLPGRYVVYMPTIEQIGISKRIGSEKERARLREAIESIKPPTGGLIVRTVAEGLTKKQLKADVGYLVRLWEEVGKKREMGGRAPTQLYQELDLVLKTARDLFTDDIKQIIIDDKDQYQRLVRFVEMFMPERVKDIILYAGDEPIFDAYGIEDEISRALSRKVPLPSGGYLIIDQAEALTAIDVNTGRYVGKGSKDLEDTLLKTNLEAVEEIAYQLRFRNLGGLIVLDLIDMERAQNREKVRRRLEDLLQKDKAKTTLNRISDLGLIEMTRKRTRESLGRLLHEPCFYCDGTGQLQSKQTVAYEILRQLRRDRAFLPGYSVLVNAHPAVIDLMKGEEREAVQEAERRFMRRIELVPRKEYHLEQFDLAGK
jgi:ribonuclease G